VIKLGLAPELVEQALVIADEAGNVWQLRENEWEEIEGLPPKYAKCSICASPDGFFITGGVKDGVATKKEFRYEAETEIWRILPPMLHTRSLHGAAYQNGSLYVVGGESNGESLRSVEKLDFKEQKWIDLPNLWIDLSLPYTTRVNGQLYIFGSWLCNSRFSTNVYLLHNNRWKERKTMAQKCRNDACAALNDNVYVWGGNAFGMMRYNTTMDTWSNLSTPRFPHRSCAATAWKGKIVLFGGDNTDAIEEFDPASGQWSTWELKMPASKIFRSAFKMRAKNCIY
jgi:hypothetical protein